MLFRSNIDYALWLTSKELAPSWRPAFEAGQMNFGSDAEQVAFAFSAINAGAPVELLMRDLYGTDVSADKRARLVELIGVSADANQLGRLATAAIGAGDAATISTVLTVAATRRVTPVVEAGELQKLVTGDDVVLRRLALQAIGQWNIGALKQVLQNLLASGDADAGDLAAGLTGIVQGKDAALLDQMQTLAADPQRSATVRAAVLERLSVARPAVAARLVAGLLAELPGPAVAAGATRSLLNEKNGPKLLTEALTDRELKTDVALEVLRVLRESGRTDAELEAALKKSGRVAARKTLTEEQKMAILKKATTDAKAADGERIFRTESLGCLKCHAIGAAGGLVGPDMISLGASAQPDYLLESLLNPNAKVKENYHTTVIATVEGQVIAEIGRAHV